MLEGLMQEDFQLTLHHPLHRMRSVHPGAEVVTLTDSGTVRATYGEVVERVDRLARVLEQLGVKQGDRVGTFAWNNQRHLELYMAVPCIGAVLHTLNIRLFAEQLTYIVNHAEDGVIFVDDSVVPILQELAPTFEGVRNYIVMGDGDEDPPAPRCPTFCATRSCWSRQGPDRSSTPSSTSARQQRSATRAAPPATPRACSTRTARFPCTPRPH